MEKYYLYIVLTRTNTVISKLIQFVKNDEYTHASLSLDKELNYMYSFARKRTYNPFIGGFSQEDINKGLYKFQNAIPGVIMEVEVSRSQYEKAKGLLDHFISNKNLYKYNYKGLLHSLLNKTACYENRFLCSEFVYHILKESDITDLNMPRNLVRPQSLLKLKSKVIYKGNLKDVKSPNNNCNIREIIMSKLSTVYE